MIVNDKQQKYNLVFKKYNIYFLAPRNEAFRSIVLETSMK